jgi:glycosyltransferase involved in cell wall biosynthesis
MEVILVDDGSPDQCPAMCDRWAAKDTRIRVIHQENGGLSEARNSGIEIARGEYLTFVDSDDYLETDTLAPLLAEMDDADMVEYAIRDRLALPDCTYTDINEYWLKGQAYLHTYACNKIYRSVLFEQVRYPKGKVFEDAYTLPELLRKARKVKTSSKGFYHYCWNEQGITATATGQQLRQLLEAHMTNGMPMDDTYYLHLLNIQIDVCEQTGDVPRLMPRKVDTTKFTGANKLKAIANNLLGIKQLCKITHFVHHIKKPNRW